MSGTNNSGFAFWNIIMIDAEVMEKCAMGSMTITSGYDAVEYIPNSIVEMYPSIWEKTETMLSDLANIFIFIL